MRSWLLTVMLVLVACAPASSEAGADQASADGVETSPTTVAVGSTEPTNAADEPVPTEGEGAAGEATDVPDEATASIASDPQEAAVIDDDSPPTDTAPTDTASTDTASTDTAPSETTPTEMTERAATCVRLTDFTDPAANEQWLVVNDDVMGGRSDGERSFTNSTMRFSGDLNTNGGGFASLRLPLEPGVLDGATHVLVRARPDGRSYQIRFRDSLDGRDRRENLTAPLPFEPAAAGEWQEVRVELADLQPVIFGRPIDGQPFEPALATRLGLMQSDGIDGPFQLEVDWIDICRPPT